MTVKELIAHLNTGDPEAIVAVFDHFGRPIALTAWDFAFENIKIGHNPQGLVGAYVRVTAVDIGPEPE